MVSCFWRIESTFERGPARKTKHSSTFAAYTRKYTRRLSVYAIKSIVGAIGLVTTVPIIAQNGPVDNSQTMLSRPSPIRNEQAINILKASLSALIGQGSQSQDFHSILSGTFVTSDNNASVTGTFSWRHSAVEFRSDQMNNRGDAHTFSTGHGHPKTKSKETIVSVPPLIANGPVGPHFPVWIFWDYIKHEETSIDLNGMSVVDGKSYYSIRLNAISDPHHQFQMPQEWLIDPLTMLPFSVRYSIALTNQRLSNPKTTVTLSDYKRFGAIQMPCQIVVSTGTLNTTSYTITSVDQQTTISDEDFDLVSGGNQ